MIVEDGAVLIVFDPVRHGFVLVRDVPIRVVDCVLVLHQRITLTNHIRTVI